MDVRDRIIVPLDVPSHADALSLVEQLPQVTFWKVGLELFVSSGPSILQELKARGKRIFLDLKFHDIPNTMAGACRAAGHYGVDLLTLHASAGKEALTTAVAAAREGAGSADVEPPALIAITILTSIASRTLAYELKIPLELTDYALQMALLAQDSGLHGIVCSAQEAAQLRRFLPQDFILVCPGVRPTWASGQDQKRVMTPGAALKAGATYLVIGRPITTHSNPTEAFQQICDECMAAVGS
jgi:orotidine-5'-phosphate decarboxylase